MKSRKIELPVGIALAKMRRRRGMRQLDVVLAMGETGPNAAVSLRHIECGHTTPSINYLEKIAKVYKVNVSAIICNAELILKDAQSQPLQPPMPKRLN